MRQERAPHPAPPAVAVLQAGLLEWYATHGRDLPWRQARDPYAILVAEIMLQQTQVRRVLPKFHQFLALFPTWKALAEAPTRDVIRAWSSLGYNQRALRLQKLAQEVVERWGGELPGTLTDLLSLEGVGPYTAAAVASFVHRQDVPVLDTNVRRVLSRVLFGGAVPPEARLRAGAAALVPPGRSHRWNQALMDVGATLCRVRQPRCSLCPLREWCVAASRRHADGPRVAEAAPRYGARSAPFRGSTRYYRGRIVERLRRLSDGEVMPLETLGRAIRPAFGPEDRAWLLRLLHGLEEDGLVALREAQAQEGSQMGVTVSLP